MAFVSAEKRFIVAGLGRSKHDCIHPGRRPNPFATRSSSPIKSVSINQLPVIYHLLPILRMYLIQSCLERIRPLYHHRRHSRVRVKIVVAMEEPSPRVICIDLQHDESEFVERNRVALEWISWNDNCLTVGSLQSVGACIEAEYFLQSVDVCYGGSRRSGLLALSIEDAELVAVEMNCMHVSALTLLLYHCH